MALARLYITHAKLWVLDEPFVALDKQSLENLRTLLHQHVQQGGMLVFTSHQPVTLSKPGEYAVNVQPIRMVAAL
jgi:heme exporter protein A